MSKVVITIPAYNEEASIGTIIRKIRRAMDKTKEQYKIQVVDDGSTDKTADVAKKAGAIVFSHQFNQGLAETFRTEMNNVLELKPNIIVHIDADEQYNPEDIPKLIAEVRKGYDLVLGNRFAGGIEDMPWLKRLGNRAFSKTISKIIHYPIGDCQTGFRAFTREIAENIRITSEFTYTQEQIIRAVRQKYRLKEIPIYFHRRSAGKSKLMRNPIDYAWKAWVNILRVYRDYDPMKFFGKIGAVILGIGIAIGIWLVYLFLKTGKVGHLPLTVLTLLLIVSGIQIIVFGFLADMHGK